MRFKLWSVIICFLCAACLLVACDGGVAEDTSPSVEDSLQWDRNIREHWYISDNGKKSGIESHTLNEDCICIVCGSEVWEFEDGSADIYNYNEHGDYTRMTSIDIDSSVIADVVYENEYDADGQMLWQKQYDDGFLIMQIFYTVNDNGARIPTEQFGYCNDGSSIKSEYDTNGNRIKQFSYDPDGNVIYEVSTEYAPIEDGVYYEAKKTIVWGDGRKSVSESNIHGDKTFWAEHDSNGDIVHQYNTKYEYGDDGNMTRSEVYIEGILVSEAEYSLNADGFLYLAMETIYDEETYIVTTFDEYGDVIEEIVYDLDGNVIG